MLIKQITDVEDFGPVSESIAKVDGPILPPRTFQDGPHQSAFFQLQPGQYWLRQRGEIQFRPRGVGQIEFEITSFDSKIVELPEPSTGVLLGCGMAAITFYGWCRRRR